MGSSQNQVGIGTNGFWWQREANIIHPFEMEKKASFPIIA
jgi:hypothetical protein